MSNKKNYIKNYITVLGVDRKLHTAEPHSNATSCGIKILQKKVTKKDTEKYFSCWGCTY